MLSALEVESPRSRYCWQYWFPLRPLSFLQSLTILAPWTGFMEDDLSMDLVLGLNGDRWVGRSRREQGRKMVLG